ncbi:MAG: PAS domain S-box protein, partial [Syntrophobacteraceae bacterium]
MILLSLINNISLLVALTVMHQMIMRKWEKSSIKYQILSGILFGSVGMVGMMTPLTLSPGIIFDGRSIILCVSGLFGGPLVASVAAGICACYRFYLGGAGALVGTAVIVEAAFLGVGYHLLRRRNGRLMGIFPLLSFGLLVHVVMLVLMMALPGGAGREVLRQVSLPVLLVYPFAVMLVSRIFLDNEEHLQAEKALKESEERHRTLVQTAMDGILCTDMQGRLVQVNDAYCRMSGYSESELLTMSIADLETIQTSADVITNIQKIAARGYARFESCHRRKNGSTYDIDVSIQYLRNPEGRIVAFMRDITERKNADKALHESELRLRTILQTVNEGFWLIDNDTITVDLNLRMCAIMGRKREEVLGKTIFDFVDNENKAIFEQQVRLRAQGQAGAYEIAISRPDGSHVFCQFNVTPFLDGSGNKVGAFAMVTDISERKQAEDALRHSEAKYRELFTAVSDAILVFDADTLRLIDMNESALHCYGYTREEFLNLGAMDITADPEISRKSVEATAKQQVRVPLRYHRKKDGTVFPVEISAVRFLLRERTLVCGVVRDITERKRAEEEKQKLEAELNHAQKMESIGRLAGGVAHDFNNMLGVIIGRAEMAIDQVGKTDLICEDLQEILKAAHRSADITRQLLAFARRQTAAPQILDLNDSISGILKMLGRLIGEDIDLLWAPKLDLWKVKIDPSQVDQILANFMVNARDAISGVGAVTMRTENVVIDDSSRVEIPEFFPGEYVLLKVSDTGAGMSQEVRENIFEPFFTTKEVGKGTGLGLSTVYGIV